MNSNEWQAEIDRQARDYDSQIEDLNAQIQLLERDKANLTALRAEDAQIIDGLRKGVEGAVSATHDYQTVAHVQSGVLQSFKADLDAQRQLTANLKQALNAIANGDVDNCQQYAQSVLTKYMTSLLV